MAKFGELCWCPNKADLPLYWKWAQEFCQVMESFALDALFWETKVLEIIRYSINDCGFTKGNLDGQSRNPAKKQNDLTSGNVDGFFPKNPQWNPFAISSVSNIKPSCQGRKFWPLHSTLSNSPWSWKEHMHQNRQKS